MIKKILMGLIILGIIGFGFKIPNTYAIDCDNLPGYNIEYSQICGDQPDIATDTIPALVGVLMWGIGIVSVAMIVFGGIMMTSSAGNPERAKKGRMAAIGGVGGLVIAILSYAIVSFVYTNI